MITTCGSCGRSYDDAKCWTQCPHQKLMSDMDMERKIAGIALLEKAQGKRVRFVEGYVRIPDFEHSENGMYTIVSMGWNGWISLAGMDVEFPPEVFEVVD